MFCALLTSRYQVSVNRTNGPLVFFLLRSDKIIRTLVAMATYSSHRLIMGKVEIAIFFCLNGDIWNNFLQKCLLSSSTFHITFVQIGIFDWLSGRQKGSIFVKMFKNLLLRNH